MKIEIRRNYVLIDGKQVGTSELFSYSMWNEKKPSYLDLRRAYSLNQVEEIEFINKSGRHIYIVGVNDWLATLKNAQAIKAHKGLMKYIGQYNVI
mgnify:CR=1 FL=1